MKAGGKGGENSSRRNRTTDLQLFFFMENLNFFSPHDWVPFLGKKANISTGFTYTCPKIFIQIGPEMWDELLSRQKDKQTSPGR